jgi:hypothetical protein
LYHSLGKPLPTRELNLVEFWVSLLNGTHSIQQNKLIQ